MAGAALATPVLAVCMRVVERERPQLTLWWIHAWMLVAKLVKLLAVMRAKCRECAIL